MRCISSWGLIILLLSSTLCAAPLIRDRTESKIIAIDLAGHPNPEHGQTQWTLLTAQLHPSADMRHIVYTHSVGEKSCLVRDGANGPWHDMVYLQPDSFTANGHFYAWLRDGEQWTLVFDEKEYHALKPAVMTPLISPDSKHIAYFASQGNRGDCVVLDGVEGKCYAQIVRPFFSPDSRHLGYAAWTGWHWVLVVDGKELPGEAESVDGCCFSPDSRHFAAALRSKGKSVLQIDGVPGKAYDSLEQFSYTANGLLRFVAKTGDRLLMVTGSEERDIPGYSHELVLSADGKHIAYLSGSFRKLAAVIDGVTGPDYLDIRLGANPFTPDGHVRYLAFKADGWVAVIDGKELPVGADPIMPVLSPDGKRQARQVAMGHQAKMVVDGVDGVLYDYISTPIFSPDSRHLAYFACRSEQTMLVIDGQEGQGYDAVVAPRLYGRRPMKAHADPTPISPILSGGAGLFTGANRVSYLIYRDKAVYLVEEMLR